jgi:Lrp/AsnC family transcriptional regulator, leucine-responsive regulatory protein
MHERRVRELDNIDLGILHCLKENARQKASEISEKTHLSVSAVIERIRKLERQGVIKHYTVVLDPKKLGYDIMAYVEISLENPNYYDDFISMVMKNDCILSCSYITGDFDFLLKVMTESSESLEKIHREIKTVKGVMSTKTYFVLSNIKDEVAIIGKNNS